MSRLCFIFHQSMEHFPSLLQNSQTKQNTVFTCSTGSNMDHSSTCCRTVADWSSLWPQTLISMNSMSPVFQLYISFPFTTMAEPFQTPSLRFTTESFPSAKNHTSAHATVQINNGNYQDASKEHAHFTITFAFLIQIKNNTRPIMPKVTQPETTLPIVRFENQSNLTTYTTLSHDKQHHHWIGHKQTFLVHGI